MIDVSAWISANGEVDHSAPWYSYDIPADNLTVGTGNYSVRALDNAGQTLAEQKFSLKFTTTDNPPRTLTVTATNSFGKVVQQTIQFTVKNEEDPDIFEPLPNAMDEIAVESDKVWRIKLSQPVETDSVTPDNVCVSYIDSNDDEVNFPVDLNFEDDNKTIVVSPKAGTNYQQGEHYTLWIKDLKSSANVPLKTRIYRDFTIQ